MIMGGRGRRITGEEQEPAKVGGPELPPALPNNLPSLISQINEINVTGTNASLLSRIKSAIKEIFTTKDTMRSALSDLHKKALSDAEFGDKLVLALELVSDLEVEGALLRNELLSFIQDDFKVKETVFHSDRGKFLNSVMLLGCVYNRIKVCGEPIAILGIALLEYFDLLIKGEEDELKTLTKQVFINGANLSHVNRYELLVYDLRKIITNENLSPKSKCWILLAIDFISNEWKPLKGIIRNFYVANLGEEFKKLELLISNEKLNQFTFSSNNVKTKEVTPEKKNKMESSSAKGGNFKKDLSKNFSDMSLKSERGNKEKVQSPPGKSSKKDIWKSSGGTKKGYGHDDRFEREENFYGVPKPRQFKTEGQRKNFSDSNETKKESDTSITDFEKITESQPVSGSEVQESENQESREFQ